MRGKTIGLRLGEVYAKGHLWESLALQTAREHVWGERVKESKQFTGASRMGWGSRGEADVLFSHRIQFNVQVSMSNGNARCRMISGWSTANWEYSGLPKAEDQIEKSWKLRLEKVHWGQLKNDQEVWKANEKGQSFISRVTPGPGLWEAFCGRETGNMKGKQWGLVPGRGGI